MSKKLKEWFDRDCATRLGNAIKRNQPSFDVREYAACVDTNVTALELKDRVLFMATALRERLPDDYPHAARILERSLGPPLPGETGMFTEGYWLMPVARLVEEFGLEHFDVSLLLCAEITRRHTSEYAVRPYLVADPDRALAYFHDWVNSPDAHIRRLASEGARPRLPWAKRLDIFIDDPEPALAIIEPLRADPSAYVRKSVANLINDVSKDHPNRVKHLVRQWEKDNHPHTNWIIRHGTRSIRK